MTWDDIIFHHLSPYLDLNSKLSFRATSKAIGHAIQWTSGDSHNLLSRIVRTRCLETGVECGFYDENCKFCKPPCQCRRCGDTAGLAALASILQRLWQTGFVDGSDGSATRDVARDVERIARSLCRFKDPGAGLAMTAALACPALRKADGSANLRNRWWGGSRARCRSREAHLAVVRHVVPSLNPLDYQDKSDLGDLYEQAWRLGDLDSLVFLLDSGFTRDEYQEYRERSVDLSTDHDRADVLRIAKGFLAEPRFQCLDRVLEWTYEMKSAEAFSAVCSDPRARLWHVLDRTYHMEEMETWIRTLTPMPPYFASTLPRRSVRLARLRNAPLARKN